MYEAKRNILSSDRYAEIEKQGFTIPYIVELHGCSKQLLFYGSEHTNNAKHPQFQDIEKRWQQFIASENRPIALVEGHFDEVPEIDTKDKTKCIIEGGEAQFLVYLARKSGVEVASPEPDIIFEASELAKEFGRDNVIFYYFIRQIGWWSGFTEKPDFITEANKMLSITEKKFQWDDVEFSIERMVGLHNELFDKPLDMADTQWIYDLTTPASQKYITNSMARRSGEIRDAHIFEEIQKYWQAGTSPFVVFGSGHAIKLEPALRGLELN